MFLGKEASDLSRYEEAARSLLAKYAEEATLVITSALHCAQPCLALGIPVVFIEPDKDDATAERFSSFRGIIPIWNKEDLENGKVDFSPEVPNIEPLKELLLENLSLSIKKAHGEKIDTSRLVAVREKIATFNLLPTTTA